MDTKTWGRLRKVLEKEEVSSEVAGMFYQGVVASHLLYGTRRGCCLPLGSVLSRASMSRRPPYGHEAQEGRQGVGVPPLSGRLEVAGLRAITDTIVKRRSNIAKTIEGRQVLKECREAKRRRDSPPPLPPPQDVVGPGA